MNKNNTVGFFLLYCRLYILAENCFSWVMDTNTCRVDDDIVIFIKLLRCIHFRIEKTFCLFWKAISGHSIPKTKSKLWQWKRKLWRINLVDYFTLFSQKYFFINFQNHTSLAILAGVSHDRSKYWNSKNSYKLCEH